MPLVLQGSGVSNGIAIGKAYILERDQLDIAEYAIPPERLDEEIIRFRAAVATAREELHATRAQIPASAPAEIAAFIETYLLMLDDHTLSSVPEEIIRKQGCNAEWALKMQRDALVRVFDEMDDPYLRTRRDDVDHVVRGIQRNLLQANVRADTSHIASLHNRILVADDLSPADVVLFHNKGIAGFVMESGGPTSHAAILARSVGIPAIVGVHHARAYLRHDENLVVDSYHYIVVADPDDYALRCYERRRAEREKRKGELRKLRGLPAVTCDGVTVSLQGNIELPEDVAALQESGADGVGLYRTEFLFMNRTTPPHEEEQLEAYLEVVKQLDGAPLTIRTLDLGADKQVESISSASRSACNPALGLRAIRLCLKDPVLFIPQLRAVLRASAHGPVRMMIPMLSNIHEVIQVLHLVKETQNNLAKEGINFDPQMPVGGMIEVPAAALSAELFAKHLDFLSLGTNDLIQYTLAIDRVDDEVNYLYDPLNPAVLRLIKMVIDAGQRFNKPVAMCGEMAGDPHYTRLLLGLGLRSFSMHPSMVPEIKYVINQCNAEKLDRHAQQLMRYIQHDSLDSLIDALTQVN